MFMESLLDDGLEHCVRDTVLPPPPLLGRSAEPARKRHSRGPRPRPRDDPVDPCDRKTPSEPQSLMRTSYAVFCLKKTKSGLDPEINQQHHHNEHYRHTAPP